MEAVDKGGAATYDDEEGFIQFISEHKPKDFKAPRKSRASKKSSEERAVTEYDCQLCDARVWNNTLGGQCSRKKIDGECLCSIHMKESTNNDGLLRNGLITEDRPTHAYGDESQQLLPWHDVEIPKKTKKTSGGEGKGKGTRKCSNCGECGHNKKTCPLLKCETVEKVVKKVEEVEDVVSTVRAALTEVVNTVETTVETVQEDNGTGVGLQLIEDTHDVVQEGSETTKDESPKDESPNTEPLSDQELEEDASGDTITFEGIVYTLDTEENMVYDDELQEMGTWDGENIEFLNATLSKLHRVRRLSIKHD